jgi:alkanesulfonate monooxygenase SsuD/methylene tetrahydromethanopterin reductase-like flavin-dependent oxidoreductase (luciferase family)
MDVSMYIRDFVQGPVEPMHQQIDNAAEVVRRAGLMGFMGIYTPQHWVARPTVWLQLLLLLARLASEGPELKLIPGVLQLPLYNPVNLPQQVITMDHICDGRFILGLGMGYRETELEAAGATRK